MATFPAHVLRDDGVLGALASLGMQASMNLELVVKAALVIDRAVLAQEKRMNEGGAEERAEGSVKEEEWGSPEELIQAAE